MHLASIRSLTSPSSEKTDKLKLTPLSACPHVRVVSALLRRSSLDPDRRRFSLGTSTPHRASDASLDPHHAAMLFRDSRGLTGGATVATRALSCRSVLRSSGQKLNCNVPMELYGYWHRIDRILTNALSSQQLCPITILNLFKM
uniref:Uncharacterized protein n=1 Tax=Timema genevievae TaxID=629358 RepID=A0A7R9JWW7_TIMGE|nr:unnamed protein product [Timema genevievae]